ncbi:ribonuclease III [Clostridium guangxiense]|uniref:ribonuclease III n=1 Tax=Clostridium guangxiense TaxID=1662055 RepID=UPI001E4C93DD|nr:ribonuclease III [Clostridium guangxiense]MCD2346001.1 ribonuclease III [Clostridium guangxiense]
MFSYEDKKLSDLEKKIGIEFNDKELIKTAITHSSYANENRNIKYNERLEFLGDAVLELSISEYLFKKYEDISEGELTRKRALIVCEASLHEISKKWELGNYIKMSKGEELTGGRTRVSILSDCVEAVIAAIYLDKGFDYVKEFIIKVFKDIIEKAVKDEIILDYKTRLQEVLQANGKIDIKYELVKYEGPPHRRKFYINLIFNGAIKSNGIGYTKKEAEQDAACKALKGLKN